MIPQCKNKNIYSTEEQVIGTWIDGKTLYRKVFGYIVPSSSVFTKIIELSENIEIKSFCGKFISALNAQYPLPYGEGQYFNSVIVIDNEIRAAQNGFEGAGCSLILEYTKTKD